MLWLFRPSDYTNVEKLFKALSRHDDSHLNLFAQIIYEFTLVTGQSEKDKSTAK